ncbi:hypothetical protein Moror_11779, partial [Moniliophthora roreri MCA 2997]
MSSFYEQDTIVNPLMREFVDAHTLGPHHVTCLAGNQTDYDITNSISHEETCERLRRMSSMLEQDSIMYLLTRDLVDARTLGPHHVVCMACEERISLDPNTRYDIKKWDDHEKTCKNVQTGRPLYLHDSQRLLQATDGHDQIP